MKNVATALFILMLGFSSQAQITPSISIPDQIPQYDGTYEDFGQGEFYYPNGGEIRFADLDRTNAIDVVKYYTMNTYPKRFLLSNNNISLCYDKADYASIIGGAADTLHRIDLEWQNSNVGASLARIDTQYYAALHYLTEWFGSSGRTNVMGGASIACQSIYNNIDLVYTSNTAGLVMYFIVYPGGDYNDILLHINGSKANSIVSNKLKVEANWEFTTFEKPKMYQYTISGNTVTPYLVCNASWANAGTDLYQIGNSTPYNTSMPLIIQIKQGNPSQVTTPGLKWSTYFGGMGFEFLTKTHTDASDNLYIAGHSQSFGLFPQGTGVNALTTMAAMVVFQNLMLLENCYGVHLLGVPA
jgi:hypothetical protein